MSEKKKVDKKKVVYDAVIEGARQGLTGEALLMHVTAQSPKASGKVIAKQSLLALSDPAVTDKPTLDAIYDLAIRHRFAEPTPAEVIEDKEAEEALTPSKKKKKAVVSDRA